MNPTFPGATLSHSDELGLEMSLLQIFGSNIAEPAFDALNKLEQNIFERSSIRNISLYSFGREVFWLYFFFAKPLTFADIGPVAGHAPENLHKFSVSIDNFAGRLVATCDKSAEHDTRCSRT